jgi:predicted TIM-barrel fold metal-dependent hydrolase
MVIDSHAHIGKSWLGWPNTYANIEDFIGAYVKHNISRVCISSWLMLYDPETANREVYEAVRKYPDRLIGFAGISPQMGAKSVNDEISRCMNEYGMKGIKVNPSEGRFYCNSVVMEPVFKGAMKYNVPILLHSSEDNYSNPSLILEIVERYPELKIIIAHIGGERWLEAIAIAATHKNVYVDTTGCSPQKWVIPMAIETSGEDKVIWGSDFPALNIASEMAKITDSDITDGIKEKILHENIAKILEI